MTIGSLFSGIGGLELGLEMCGLGPVKWQAECDPYARAVLAKHWPSVKRYADVREIDETAERVDIICGGFPCQDISSAGRKVGISGKKSALWFEYVRVLCGLRPRYAFVENVGALTGRGLDRVLGGLAAIGYDAEWGVLGACVSGAPHSRKRLFVLAYADRDGEPAGPIDAQTSGLRANAALMRDWRPSPPARVRMDDGVSGGLDRLRCLGNAVVPAQAALAWRTLYGRITSTP